MQDIMASQQAITLDLTVSTTTDLQRRQASCEQLKQDIETLIEPYRTDEDTKPPFSATDLIIFALLQASDPTKGSTAKQILAQILKDFSYYAKQAMNEYVDTTITTSGSSHNGMLGGPSPKLVISNITQALNSYDLPVTTIDRYSTIIFTIEPQEARMVLSQHLEHPRRGTFRFRDLPPELRNNIYEYAFSLSDSDGLLVHNASSAWPWMPTGLVVSSTVRANGSVWNPQKHEESRTEAYAKPDHHFRLRSIRDILAVSRTCKEIYKESMPLLFSLNLVKFETFDHLTQFVAQTPPQIIRSFSRVKVTRGCYHEDHAALIPRTFGLLALADLEVFEVRLWDDDLLNMRPRGRQALGRKTKFTHFKQIPGMSSLAKVASKTKTFSLGGDCPKLQDYIKGQIDSLRASERLKQEQEAKVKIKEEDTAETDVKGGESVSKKVSKKRPTKKQTTTEQTMKKGSGKRKIKIKKEEVDDQKVVKRRSQRLAGRMN